MRDALLAIDSIVPMNIKEMLSNSYGLFKYSRQALWKIEEKFSTSLHSIGSWIAELIIQYTADNGTLAICSLLLQYYYLLFGWLLQRSKEDSCWPRDSAVFVRLSAAWALLLHHWLVGAPSKLSS